MFVFWVVNFRNLLYGREGRIFVCLVLSFESYIILRFLMFWLWFLLLLENIIIESLFGGGEDFVFINSFIL